jgi:hypothetical protein
MCKHALATDTQPAQPASLPASQPGPVSPVMPDLDALTFPADLQDRPIASRNGQPIFLMRGLTGRNVAQPVSCLPHHFPQHIEET